MWPGVTTSQFLFYMISEKICEMGEVRKGNGGTVLKSVKGKKTEELAML